MQFELTPESDSPNSCTITLNCVERGIVNEALINTLHTAATVGEQLPVGSILEGMCRQLLKPENFSTRILRGMQVTHLNILSNVVVESNVNMPFEKTKEVGDFISQLSVAARVVGENSIMEVTLSDDVIEEVVAHTAIPDSPGDLE